MDEKTINKVAEGLYMVPPLLFRNIRRNIVKSVLSSIDLEISPIHFEIMKLLSGNDTMTITAIGDTLLIARAQMTHLIDKMEASGIVERKVGRSDRRTTDIALTPRGREILTTQDMAVKNAFYRLLEKLTDRELEEISSSLDTLQRIFTKQINGDA